MSDMVFIYSIVFVFGITIGSFLNVCILRIPAGESIVTAPSRCPICEKRLTWYELIPVISWLALGGKCKGCKTKISPQYPIIECINGILWMVIFWRFWQDGLVTVLIMAVATSALLSLSVIDERTQEIPFGFNIFIFVLGIINVALNFENIALYGIGFFAVSGFLILVLLVTRGRGIGGGDIKLMASCGLLIGFKLIILAFFIGCTLGAVIHIIRMKCAKKSNVLALGPYLSVGVFAAMIWGTEILAWYLQLFI